VACARDDRWVDEKGVLRRLHSAVWRRPVDDACAFDMYRASVPA